MAYSNIFWTDAEVAVWVDREVNGPYKITGDVNSKSPGDFDRIASHAASFLADPSADRYTPDNASAPLPNGYTTYLPYNEHDTMASAALYYTINKSSRLAYGTAVKNEIYAQATEVSTDWSNRTRWPADYYGTAYPMQVISWWINRFIIAYTAVRDLCTGAEQTTIDNWLLAFANWAIDIKWIPSADYFINRYDFVRDPSEDYYRVGITSGSIQYIWSWGVWREPVAMTTLLYQSSHVNQILNAGLIGCMFGVSDLIDRAKQIFKELASYDITTDLYSSAMCRLDGEAVEKPWDYSMLVIGRYFQFADAYARYCIQNGISNYAEMLDYGAEGTNEDCSTAGRRVIDAYKNMMKMSTGETTIYFRGYDGSTSWIINGTNNVDTKWVSQIWICRANMYFQDSSIRDFYVDSTNTSYSIATHGSQYVWDGMYGDRSVMLGLYGQMEDSSANPYLNLNIGLRKFPRSHNPSNRVTGSLLGRKIKKN